MNCMNDTQRHLCSECGNWGRSVDWKPLIGSFMHYECWLELRWENLKRAVNGKKAKGRPRLARAIMWQMDLFGEIPGSSGTSDDREAAQNASRRPASS